MAEDVAKAIDVKAFSFAQSMMDNSNELARIINDASASAAVTGSAAPSRRLAGFRPRASVSQATVTLAQTLKDLQQSTTGAIEQSKEAAAATVSETPRNPRACCVGDTSALFERLRDGNILLQEVVRGAQTNL